MTHWIMSKHGLQIKKISKLSYFPIFQLLSFVLYQTLQERQGGRLLQSWLFADHLQTALSWIFFKNLWGLGTE
jgi:hypothetical protein